MTSRTASDYPKPVHDFRVVEDYVDRGDDREAWAWEFIRRKPRYQFLVDGWRLDGSRGYEGSAFGLLDMEFYPWSSDWRDDALAERTRTARGAPVHRGSAAPWCVLKPGVNIDSELHRAMLQRALLEELEHRDSESVGMASKTAGFVFDITAPIEPQLQSVREHLARMQVLADEHPRVLQKPGASKGVMHLRVLDALAGGAGPAEIMGALGLSAESSSNFAALIDALVLANSFACRHRASRRRGRPAAKVLQRGPRSRVWGCARSG